METPTWSIELRGGKLLFDLRDAFDAWLKTRRNGRYVLIIKEWRNRRSTKANAFYWGPLLDCAVNEIGQPKEIIHQRLKEVIVPIGEARGRLGIIPTESTAEMDSARFAWYCQQACAVLAQDGVDLSGLESTEGWR